MINMNIIQELYNDYAKDTATTYFVFAYTEKSKPMPDMPVYFSIVPTNEAAAYLTVDHKSTSRGKGIVLRFKPTKTQKFDMYSVYGRIELTTFAEVNKTLEMLRKTVQVNSKAINRGHAIEYLLCKRWGIEWQFDNASHKVRGDITINGEELQVKFQCASL